MLPPCLLGTGTPTGTGGVTTPVTNPAETTPGTLIKMAAPLLAIQTTHGQRPYLPILRLGMIQEAPSPLSRYHRQPLGHHWFPGSYPQWIMATHRKYHRRYPLARHRLSHNRHHPSCHRLCHHRTLQARHHHVLAQPSHPPAQRCPRYHRTPGLLVHHQCRQCHRRPDPLFPQCHSTPGPLFHFS